MKEGIKQIAGGQGGSVLRYVVMGVSGCGKSEIGARLAARLGYPHLEGDRYHSPGNIEKMAAGIPLNDGDRRDWLARIAEAIAEARRVEAGLVISCSALKRAYRDMFRDADPDLFFVHLAGDRELISQRMLSRPNHFMPVSLLDSQLKALEPLAADERGIQLDITLAPDDIVRRALEHATST